VFDASGHNGVCLAQLRPGLDAEWVPSEEHELIDPARVIFIHQITLGKELVVMAAEASPE
jgi:hypothetical protein